MHLPTDSAESALPLAGSEPEEWDLTPDRRCLCEVVAVTGVGLLGERIEACVLSEVGDLARNEILAPELAFAVRLEVVVPLRVLLPAVIGGDQDWIAPI